MERNNLNKKHYNSSPLTYSSGADAPEFYGYIKAVGLPIGILLLAFFTISKFAMYGTKLLTPVIAGVWFTGFITAFLLKSFRKEVINQTHTFLIIYMLAMLASKQLIILASGVSSQMMMSSYQTTIPVTVGNTIPGWLQTMQTMSAVGAPIGFISMQLNRIYKFKRNADRADMLRRYRGRVDANRRKF